MHFQPVPGWFVSWGTGPFWWHAFSDAVIGCSSCCIAAALVALLVKRPEVGRATLIAVSAAGAFCCALAHLLPLITLQSASGWTEVAGHVCTALLSAAAALTVWPLVLRVADSPSPAKLLAINDELSRLQASTAESNRGLLMAEQLAHIGHWRVSQPDGHLTWSDEVFRIYGLPNTGAAPSLDAAFAAYHPDDRETVRRNFEIALVDQSRYEFESRLCRPNGEVRHVRSRGEVQVDASGQPICISGVFMDITAQKQAEADKMVATEKLAAAQRMEVLGRLAGGVAHDINNVLQTIATASGLIGKRADEPAEVTRLNRLIGKTADRAGAVVNRLLAFARRSELHAAHIDVAALLASLKDVLNHTLGGSVRVALEIDPGLPPLWADHHQLETVLVNLATNARDAMPRGGIITLAASAEYRDERSPLQPGLGAGAFVRLSVTDDGMGMDEAILARAVEPFYTTKPRGKGTGLGLSMASGFAEQSGGALGLRSAPGDGTCVTIWLPQNNPAQSITIEPQAPAHPRLSILPETFVLLVDDEADLRALMAEELIECGFAVLQAGSSRDALDMLASGETVDVLVTDLSMPGLDGVGLIEAAQQHRRGLPAILLTGHAHDDARLNANHRAEGRYTLLTKPIRASELIAHVVRLLGSAPHSVEPAPQDVLAA